MKHKKRCLRKGRCLLLLTICIFLFSFFGGVFNAQAGDQPRELQPVAVRSGDTLWELVDKYYQYEGDIRAAIYEVKQINDLNSAALTPGQIIYIPAK